MGPAAVNLYVFGWPPLSIEWKWIMFNNNYRVRPLNIRPVNLSIPHRLRIDTNTLYRPCHPYTRFFNWSSTNAHFNCASHWKWIVSFVPKAYWTRTGRITLLALPARPLPSPLLAARHSESIKTQHKWKCYHRCSYAMAFKKKDNSPNSTTTTTVAGSVCFSGFVFFSFVCVPLQCTQFEAIVWIR